MWMTSEHQVVSDLACKLDRCKTTVGTVHGAMGHQIVLRLISSPAARHLDLKVLYCPIPGELLSLGFLMAGIDQTLGHN